MLPPWPHNQPVHMFRLLSALILIIVWPTGTKHCSRYALQVQSKHTGGSDLLLNNKLQMPVFHWCLQKEKKKKKDTKPLWTWPFFDILINYLPNLKEFITFTPGEEAVFKSPLLLKVCCTIHKTCALVKSPVLRSSHFKPGHVILKFGNGCCRKHEETRTTTGPVIVCTCTFSTLDPSAVCRSVSGGSNNLWLQCCCGLRGG